MNRVTYPFKNQLLLKQGRGLNRILFPSIGIESAYTLQTHFWCIGQPNGVPSWTSKTWDWKQTSQRRCRGWLLSHTHWLLDNCLPQREVPSPPGVGAGTSLLRPPSYPRMWEGNIPADCLQRGKFKNDRGKEKSNLVFVWKIQKVILKLKKTQVKPINFKKPLHAGYRQSEPWDCTANTEKCATEALIFIIIYAV